MSPASARTRTASGRAGRFPRVPQFRSWQYPLVAFSHALAARPSRDTQGQSRARNRPRGTKDCRMPESTPAKPRIAVIGLGSMGFGMATSLRRAGFDVTGCDVSADAVARFVADGGKGAGTPAEAARQANIVVSVVVNA